MANTSKNIWVLVIGIAVTAGIILFALGQKQPAPQGVVLEEVFKQAPPAPAGTPVVQKDPVPSPAIVTSPTNGHEAEFAVQVYSFQDHNRADKALENLKAAGYKAYMEVSDLGEKGTWYRVRIGGIENEEKAKAILEEVRKNYQSGIIIKPKK